VNRKIKVLIVDDSTVIRRLLTDALSSDPSIEVVGVAANGKIALAKIPQLNPDLITLDMEMPEMDGLTTLVEVRKLYAKLPVIMFSTLTQRGAEATIDALSKGANDYVTKPANVGSVTAAIQNVKNELIPKIKAFCPWTTPAPVSRTVTTNPTAAVRIARPGASKTSRIDVIAIGVSTGGPNALQAVIPNLPASLGVPVVIVQHMPPIFTKHLADRLNQLSPLRVTEAVAGDTLHAGGVWVAPGDYHLVTRREGTTVRVGLNQGTPENSCRPAVDVTFRSISETYGPNVLAVILTGMGQDGAKGCDVIRQRGGRTLVQDEATSVVWGMPGAVANAGLADKIVPLHQIAAEIIYETQQGRTVRSLASMGA
jgi:two-component system, chemotaxis family, protein-glutamate methylesterase/glutaminase